MRGEWKGVKEGRRVRGEGKGRGKGGGGRPPNALTNRITRKDTGPTGAVLPRRSSLQRTRRTRPRTSQPFRESAVPPTQEPRLLFRD